MIPVQSIISKSIPAMRTGVGLSLKRTLVSGPPTQRMSFATKVALGGGLIGGIMAVPLWVLVNLKNYKK